MSTSRPLIIGRTTGLETPYPLKMEGKEFPLPNSPSNLDEAQTPWITHTKSGVYFGWSSLRLPTTSGLTIYPMVMSIGFNPQYENTARSAEVHVLHEFEEDFYGAEMRVLILGFIREEKKYPDLDALVEDIKVDCEVAKRSLHRDGWALKETGKGMLDGSWLVREC